jgi:hypothetical protein
VTERDIRGRRNTGRPRGSLDSYPRYNPRSGSLPQAGAATTAWRGARPFEGRPGASRLFGGRRRAACPRCEVGFLRDREIYPESTTYDYVKGHNPYDYFGVYDVVREDTFWLDKA